MFSQTKYDIEATQVKNFINNSYEFNKLTQIYNNHKPSDVNGVIKIVEEINEAKSFRQILWPIDRFNPDDHEGAINAFEVIVAPRLVNAFMFFNGFVDDRGNVAYYSSNLYQKTVNKMIELGYKYDLPLSNRMS